ncbi:cyclin, partial [Gregarina niphandrodes]
VVATAAVVAGKFFDDVYYSNEHYASELGFELGVLNEMEMCMIVMLNYELQIDPAVF